MFTVVVVVLPINSFSRMYFSFAQIVFVAFHLFMSLQHVTFCLQFCQKDVHNSLTVSVLIMLLLQQLFFFFFFLGLIFFFLLFLVVESALCLRVFRFLQQPQCHKQASGWQRSTQYEKPESTFFIILSSIPNNTKTLTQALWENLKIYIKKTCVYWFLFVMDLSIFFHIYICFLKNIYKKKLMQGNIVTMSIYVYLVYQKLPPKAQTSFIHTTIQPNLEMFKIWK